MRVCGRNGIYHGLCAILSSLFPMRKTALILVILAAVAALLFLAVGDSIGDSVAHDEDAVFVGVMIDNHEVARSHQRGLASAPLIIEQFAEGFITRFIAFFPLTALPESVGPVRSVRSYFIDGSSPIVSAIFHVGGSPDALEALADDSPVTSFNAIQHDTYFTYDDIAPAPHHRFITGEHILTLVSGSQNQREVPVQMFPTGDAVPSEPARIITIDYRNPRHNVAYTYNEATAAFSRTNGSVSAQAMPANVLILESDVAVTGEFGRLTIRMTGSGNALLFRNGGVIAGAWSKADQSFFRILDAADQPVPFAAGQTWLTVVDDLGRVTWLP